MNQSENNNAANGTDEIYAAEIFTFDKLPENLAELQARPEASLKSAYKTTALTMAALCSFEKNENDVYEMLDFLKGPGSVSTYEQQFLRDRFMDKDYVPRSFFKGATPQNDYTPDAPPSIIVSENPYSYQDQGYAKLYLKSGGADSPRAVQLRQAKDGKWYLWDQFLLADIRKPESQNPWA